MQRATDLSLDMLQSMTVFLLVLTRINGSWIAELGLGAPFVCSARRLRCTRFLKAICWNNHKQWMMYYLYWSATA